MNGPASSPQPQDPTSPQPPPSSAAPDPLALPPRPPRPLGDGEMGPKDIADTREPDVLAARAEQAAREEAARAPQPRERDEWPSWSFVPNARYDPPNRGRDRGFER